MPPIPHPLKLVSAASAFALAIHAQAASAQTQSPTEASKVPAEPIIVTGVREGSFPNGISKKATVGMLGERALIDTPIAAKSFNATFIDNQIAFTSNDLASRDASCTATNSSALTGSDGGINFNTVPGAPRTVRAPLTAEY